MGLDIIYFAEIEEYEGEVETHENGDIDSAWVREEGLTMLIPGQSTDEKMERADGVKGLYHVEDSDGFTVGSYGHYNLFRELLARVLFKTREEEIDADIERIRKKASQKVWNEPKRYKEEPFYEQINFPDHTGLIGPETAEKLAKDYQTHEEVFRKIAEKHYGDDASGFVKSYQNWKKAFETAAESGAVKFW